MMENIKIKNDFFFFRKKSFLVKKKKEDKSLWNKNGQNKQLAYNLHNKDLLY